MLHVLGILGAFILYNFLGKKDHNSIRASLLYELRYFPYLAHIFCNCEKSTIKIYTLI